MTSFLFISNPVARGGKKHNISERISKFFNSADKGIDYSILVSEWSGHAIELARDNLLWIEPF